MPMVFSENGNLSIPSERAPSKLPENHKIVKNSSYRADSSTQKVQQ